MADVCLCVCACACACACMHICVPGSFPFLSESKAVGKLGSAFLKPEAGWGGADLPRTISDSQIGLSPPLALSSWRVNSELIKELSELLLPAKTVGGSWAS